MRKVKLKVHHHVLMSNAIDLVHFKTLHGLDVNFDYEIKDNGNGIFQWDLKGAINTGPWTLRLAKFLFGRTFDYHVLFAGGTITGIAFELPGLFNDRGPRFPSVNVIWGAIPTTDGVGEIYNFLVTKKYNGWFAQVKRMWAYLISFCVLTLLRDDDIWVYPHMRFDVGYLTAADQSMAHYIKLFNTLKISC